MKLEHDQHWVCPVCLHVAHWFTKNVMDTDWIRREHVARGCANRPIIDDLDESEYRDLMDRMFFLHSTWYSA